MARSTKGIDYQSVARPVSALADEYAPCAFTATFRRAFGLAPTHYIADTAA